MPELEKACELQSIISNLKTLLEQRNFEKAIEQVGAIPKAYLDEPKVYDIRFWIFFKAGKFEGAADAIEQAKGSGASETAILRMRSHLQYNSGDVEALEITAKRLRILQPDFGTIYTKLALAYMRHDNSIAAVKAARTALEIDPTIAIAHKTLYMAILETDNHTTIPDVILNAVTSGADYPHFPQILITLMAMPKIVAEKLQKAMIERWPQNLSSGMHSSLSVSNNIKIDAVIEQAYQLKLQGKSDQAMELIQPYYNGSEINLIHNIRTKMDILNNIPGPEHRKRDLVTDKGAEITCSPASETGVTVLFFTGIKDRAMVDITVFDAFCAQAGYGAIYLRDFSRNLFINGLESTNGDLEQTLLVIKKHLAEMGTKRLISIGASAGGFAAISYGVKLNAEQITCFSTPSSITKDNLNKFGDKRGVILARRLQGFFKRDDLDVKPQIAKANHRMPIDLYYGQNNAEDCAHAQYINDQPNVMCHPIPELSEHACIHHLIATGRLPGILTAK